MDLFITIGLPIILALLLFGVLPFVIRQLLVSTRLQQTAVARQQDGMAQVERSMQRQDEALELYQRALALSEKNAALVEEVVALARESAATQQAMLEELRLLRQATERDA